MKYLGYTNRIILALTLLFTTSLYATDAGDQLQERLNTLKSMKARFKQVVRADRREVSRSSGTMALQRPGKFRWDTREPMAQLVVADGKKLWVYDVDLEQVTVKKQEKGIGGTPALFLSGVEDTVNRDFEVSKNTKGGLQHFDMKARSPQANFQRIVMAFRGEDLVELVLHDQLGQQTTVKLNQIKRNPKLSPNLFTFHPPRGVDVVRQ